MTQRLFLLLGLTMLTLSGCKTAPIAAVPTESVIVSRLNPQFADAPQDDARADLYGFEKLADRTVTDADLVRRLLTAVANPANYDGPAHGRCFLPRLVVRVNNTSHSLWIDYVICTECKRIDTHTPDGKIESFEISPDGCDVFDGLMAELFPQYVPHSNEHAQ